MVNLCQLTGPNYKKQNLYSIFINYSKKTAYQQPNSEGVLDP